MIDFYSIDFEIRRRSKEKYATSVVPKNKSKAQNKASISLSLKKNRVYRSNFFGH